MWTFHPKHEKATSGFLFHRTPFDREYPHPFNDFFRRVHFITKKKKCHISFGTPGEKVLLNPSQIYWILEKVLSFMSLFMSKAFCTHPNSF